MDLHWLDDVLVLLEEGNLTNAAQRRNITQPAFSRRIRSFEDWLGEPIIERRANSIVLRESFRTNEPEIRALVHRIREVRRRIAHFDQERKTIIMATQHALTVSAFSNFSTAMSQHVGSVAYRIRTANRADCVSMFLRGDATLLMCYETPKIPPLVFNESVQRVTWGQDRLIPVVGANLKYRVNPDGTVPDDLPTIVYPEQSFFGEVLQRTGRQIATPPFSNNLFCETAFSAGVKEMVMCGMGIAWIPVSMVVSELETGQLADLSSVYGSVPLTISLFNRKESELAETVRIICGEA